MTNQEIEAQLQALTDLCCDALNGEALDLERTDQLTKSLLMSGFVHEENKPLQPELESRVREACREPAMHRGAEIKAVTDKVQSSLNKHVRWESKQPEGKSPAKGANISSATDA